MSVVSLNFSLVDARRTSIGSVLLDTMTSTSVVFKAATTQYPVENGSQISDHVTLEPEKLSIKGVVSSATTTLYEEAGRHRLVSTEDLLRQLHKSRQTIHVQTDLTTYPDMVMESCTISRDNSGDHVTIDCDFSQVIKVNLKTTEIPPEIVAQDVRARAGGRVNAGRTSGATPTDEQKAGAEEVMQSDLSSLIG